jgi:hypothetical protein
MSLFLTRKNNLADVENIFESRKNLGFGSLSYFDSNNVIIEGGSISTDSLRINSVNIKENSFLICTSNNGTVDFREVNLGTWVTSNINEIRFSDFDTTNVIFQENNLASIAFTGNYDDLLNKPTSFNDLDNDLDFLHKDLNNIDVEQAKINLGFGSFAYIDPNRPITFRELTITDNLIFPNEINDNNPKYLNINPDGTTYWGNLRKATTSEYGVVLLSDSYDSTDSNTAASKTAINHMFNTLQTQLNDIGSVALSTEIHETIISKGLMNKTNNLAELTNLAFARSNLGFNTSMELLIQDINQRNTINVNNIIVNSNLVFSSAAGLPSFTSDTYLAVNREGKVIPKNLSYGTNEFAGFIYLTNDYLTNNNNRTTALSVYGLSNFIENVYNTNYASISNSIDPKIRALYSEYMRVDDNIRVDNAQIARDHLGLHPIAHTGDFFQMENRPSNLSAFSNDMEFTDRTSNLSDLTDINKARSNLLIGSIAYYDSNNVTIMGGNGTFSNMTIRNHLQYNYDNTINFQNMFLKSINTNGDSRWTPLPEGTSINKGIVQLESDFEIYDDKKASTASALFKVYYKLLGEIDALNRQIQQINIKLGLN